MPIMFVVVVVPKNCQTLQNKKSNKPRQQSPAHAMNLTAHVYALGQQMQERRPQQHASGKADKSIDRF